MTGEHLLQICKKGKVRYQGRGEAVFGSVTFFDEALEESAAHLKMAESRMEADWVDGEKAMTYLEYGSIQHLPYPFTPEKYVNRQTDLIESTKSLFSDASSSCTLGFSPVALSSKTPEENSSRSLGVFATRNIHFAERLVDTAAPSTLKSTPNSSRICNNCYGSIPRLSGHHVLSKCCKTSYCSARCRDMALASYHRVQCGQNFDWVYDESRGNHEPFVLNGPMWLRILAACVQSNGHPLDHPLIARLTPLHDELPRTWTLSNNIITPVKILQQLGISPMEDLRYDTWTLTDHLDPRHQQSRRAHDTRRPAGAGNQSFPLVFQS